VTQVLDSPWQSIRDTPGTQTFWQSDFWEWNRKIWVSSSFSKPISLSCFWLRNFNKMTYLLGFTFIYLTSTFKANKNCYKGKMRDANVTCRSSLLYIFSILYSSSPSFLYTYWRFRRFYPFILHQPKEKSSRAVETSLFTIFFATQGHAEKKMLHLHIRNMYVCNHCHFWGKST